MTLKNIFSIFFLLTGLSAFAQQASSSRPGAEAVTDTFTVAGSCQMCRKRIEGALDIPGVKAASWSPETRKATVTYRPGKITLPEIKQAVAEAGHDVPGYHAPEKAYNRLHDCCKYRP